MISKKKKIFADDHRFSAKPTPVKYKYGRDCVYLGDNHDVHCLRKNAKAMIAASDKHRCKCATSKGVIQVRGNHEGCYGYNLPEYVVEDGVLYTHHDPFYSDKDRKKWYAKEAGIPRWKFYGIKATNFFRNLKGNKVSKKKLQILARYAYGKDTITSTIHTIVTCHIHKSCDEEVNIKVDGFVNTVRVIVCNCGLTEIEV